jgi:hypothetical protein
MLTLLSPIIGGVLSHPGSRWPHSIGKFAFFNSHPYFLPCIVAAMVPLSACIFTAVFMKEVSAQCEYPKG